MGSPTRVVAEQVVLGVQAARVTAKRQISNPAIVIDVVHGAIVAPRRREFARKCGIDPPRQGDVAKPLTKAAACGRLVA